MLPQNIGRYEILEEIGRGGMAVVYRAHDPLFERDVAVKAVLYAYQDEVSRKRFARESKFVAGLEHPFIVPVYDFGEHENQPFLVMRYLKGGTLKERLESGPLSLAATTNIINRLAQALDHAHSKSIIHRDLKPGNVLFDQYENAYLSDFGIARLIDSATMSLTGSGVIGTPAYMSPEQIYGNGPIDGRSDIYSLGVLLYLMLTGQTPFDADTPARIMMQHLLDRIPEIRSYRPDLPPAMADIVAQTLAKEPAERFPNALALANALGTLPQSETVTLVNPERDETGHLPGPSVVNVAGSDDETSDLPELTPAQPVPQFAEAAKHQHQTGLAERPTPRIQPRPKPTPPILLTEAQTGKTRGLNWRLLGGLMAGAALILVALMVIPPLLNTGAEPQDEIVFPPPPPDKTVTPTIPPSGADAIGAENPTETVAATIAPAITAAVSRRQITAGNANEMITVAQIGRGTIEEIVWQPAGSLLAVAGGDGVWLYEGEKLTPLVHLDGHERSVRTAAWSPDGSLIATASDEGTILVWDIATQQIVQEFNGHTDWIRSVRWSPDGQILLTGSSDGTVRQWHVTAGTALGEIAAYPVSVRAVAWSPDGRWRAAGLQTGEIVFFDESGNEHSRRQVDDSPIISLAWNRTSSQMAAGSINGRLSLWYPDTEPAMADIPAHNGWILSISWSPTSQRLVTTSTDNSAMIWQPSSLASVALVGHTASVTSATWRDDTSVVTGSVDGTLRVWGDDGVQQQLANGHLTSVNTVGWAPAGTQLALGVSDNSARIWDDAGREELWLLADHSSWVSSLSFSPNGQFLLTSDFNGQIRIWDSENGLLVSQLGTHRAIVNSVGWSPDSQFAASGGKDNAVRLWNVADLSASQFLTLTHASAIEALAFSPDGTMLATGVSDGTLLIWDWQNELISQRITAHNESIKSVSWSPDQRIVATTSNDGTVRLWHSETGEQLALIDAHDGWVNSVSWSFDGQLLATAGFDGMIKIWAAADWELLTTLSGHHYAVWSVSWSPDGAALLSGSGDGTVRIWGVPGLPQ